MSGFISDRNKVDIGLVPQTISNTNVTGRYHDMATYRHNLFILTVGVLAATKTAVLQLLEATAVDGTGAQAITPAVATITANTDVAKATVALASAAATDTVTINGLVFTMAASTTAADREFANAAGLVTCVNDASKGVPGVSASAQSTTVTLIAEDPGATLITVEGGNVAGTVVVATVEAIAFVELNSDMLSEGFTHVAAKVTSTGAGIAGVTLVRGLSRFGVTQKVAASMTV